MEGSTLVIAVLAAVLVGALIPVLLQLRSTLRALETTLLRTGGRLDAALVTATAAAVKVEAFADRINADGQLEKLARDVSALGHLASQVRDVVRVASAVGAAVAPAMSAGLRALRQDEPTAPAPSSRFNHVDFKHVRTQARRHART
jgi:uncharacterized protein YoxC